MGSDSSGKTHRNHYATRQTVIRGIIEVKHYEGTISPTWWAEVVWRKAAMGSGPSSPTHPGKASVASDTARSKAQN